MSHRVNNTIDEQLVDLVLEASRRGYSAFDLLMLEKKFGDTAAGKIMRMKVLQSWLADHPVSLTPQLPDGTGFPV